MIRLSIFVISVISLSGSCTVQATEPVADPAGGTVYRISPQEAEAVQAAAAARKADFGRVNDSAAPDGQIHGEIGLGIGTGGYSSVFGTAIVPLGNTGIAAFSFERTNFGRRRFRY